MGWSHSATIIQQIHGEILFTDAGWEGEDEVPSGWSKVHKEWPFGEYIDD